MERSPRRRESRDKAVGNAVAETPFDRFKDLAARLIRVERSDFDEEQHKYAAEKVQRRKRRR